MKSILFFAFALAAVALPANQANQKKKIDMALCKVESYEDCTIVKDVEKRTCTNVPSSLNDKVRSITFWGGDDCTFYVDSGCSGRNFTDTGDMPELKKRFSGKISSFECN